jgi:hypothetical protein
VYFQYVVVVPLIVTFHTALLLSLLALPSRSPRDPHPDPHPDPHQDLAPCTTVVGNPARVVGVTTSKCSGGDMDHALREVLTPQGHSYVYSHDEQRSAPTGHVSHCNTSTSTTFTLLAPPPRSKSSAVLSALDVDDFDHFALG